MKIYAIRDRMLDFYLTPFVAEDEPKVVMHSLAELINNKESKHAVAQAPHHFELWTLGEINQETGGITRTPELVADCASLVRRDVRQEHHAGSATVAAPPGGRQGAPGGRGGAAAAGTPAPANAAPSAASQAEGARRATPGGHPVDG